MKIAMIVPGGVDRSGRERVIPVLLWLIERLARRHDLHVIALQQYPESCDYPLLGAQVHNLGQPCGRLAVLHPLERQRVLLAALRWHGRFDLLHSFLGATTGLMTVVAGKLLRIPTLVGLNNGEVVGLPEIGYGAQLTLAGRIKMATVLRLASRLTVASEYMQRLTRQAGHDAVRIPLGVEPVRFGLASCAPPGPPWRLLHVASLNPVKDQSTLLRAMRKVVDRLAAVHLDIVGEDTLGGAIQRLADELRLHPYVSFHGFAPQSEAIGFFRRAHLFVLPSRHDAAPVVALEAAAHGLPIVGTAVGYVADWAPERAWAAPVGDADALAEGILTLLGDEARRRAMGLAAQSWARAHDADWSAAQLEALYEEVGRARTPTCES